MNTETDTLLESDEFGGIFIYSLDNKLLKTFQIIKVIYLSIICIILSGLMCWNLHIEYQYTTPINRIAAIYLLLSCLNLFIYFNKTRAHYASKVNRFASAILRFIWICVNINGVIDILNEKTHSPLYYFSWYLYPSNILYFIIAFVIAILVTCGCFGHHTSHDRRKSVMRIIDDNTDIELFYNVLKKDGLYNDTMCSICFDNYENDEEVRILPCKHYFHEKCIKKWFEKKLVCPLCNKGVVFYGV